VGRLNRGDLPAPIAPDAAGYVCGTPGFADAATEILIEAGVLANRIRVERFGPTR
jgi:ferredoxin-NADP reductase